MEIYGVDYLRQQLKKKQSRVKLRYDYYEMKRLIRNYSKLMPTDYKWLAYTLGWSAKAVDSIADRIVVNEFREDNFNLEELYNLNNRDILFDSAIMGALIGSCSFIYISEKDGVPTMQAIDAYDATGVLDDTTWMLKEGYAVLERDKNGNPTLEAYFEAGRTTFYTKDEEEPEVIENVCKYPLLVPIIYRPDAKKPFGHSRISRACMSLQDGAIRTLIRSEITSEFYSFPQKYILGLDEDMNFNGTLANMSNFLDIGANENGDKPTVGQFTQASVAPHLEQLKIYASMFAGETGLTLDDLGFPTANPSSSESIKAMHEQLRLTARKAQRTFAIGFLNAGFLASCIRDGVEYERNALYRTKIAYEPMFEPDIASISGAGDALIKIAQASPDYLTENKIHDLLGI